MAFSCLHCRPHTSHKLQPSDCTIFGPHITCYNAYLNNWMLSNPRKTVKIYSAVGIIGKPFSKPFVKPNVQKGIHVIGIYLLNENIFDKDENISSHVTVRTYGQVTEAANANSSSEDISEEETLTGFIWSTSIFFVMRRHFPEGGAKTNGEESMEKAGPNRHTEEESENGKRKPNIVQGNI